MVSPGHNLDVVAEEDYAKLLEAAQAGDNNAREILIKKFTPFVLRVLSKKTGRFHVVGDDDTVSIGLMGFNEAIDSYDATRGISFLSFAEGVIRRRLIDYYRKEKHNLKVVPISALETEDDEAKDVAAAITAKQAVSEYKAKREADERRDEVVAYATLLKQFDISFSELVDISPKHEDARVRAMQAARFVAGDPEMREHLIKRKELPLRQLTELVMVSRKTLERQRKYIIAVSLILIHEFVHLKEYVKGF